MGIVTFNSVANRVSPLTYIESQRSEHRGKVSARLPRNPTTVPDNQKCVLCGIQEAIRTVEDVFQDVSGTNVILISSGAESTSRKQMYEIQHLIDIRNINIIPIIYPHAQISTNSLSYTAHGFESLAVNKGTRIFIVMDEKYSKISMYVSLMNALMSAISLNGHEDIPGMTVLLEEEAFPGGTSSLSTGHFSIDDSVADDVMFSLYYYDLDHVGNVFKLTTPSGKVVRSGHDEHGDVNMIFVNLHDAEVSHSNLRIICILITIQEDTKALFNVSLYEYLITLFHGSEITTYRI